MGCSAVLGHLAGYLDGELADETCRLIEEHLRACEACRRRIDVERAFQEIYIAPLRPDEAPPDIREQAARLLAGLADPSRQRRLRWLRRAVGHRPAVAAGLAALILAGVAAGILLGSGQREAAALLRLVDASVEQHQKLARGVLPFDIRGVSPRQAEHWFGQKLDFNVRLPELKGEHLTFLGGRIAHLEGSDVAALEYRVDHHNVSLFILPAEQYRRLGLQAEPKFKMVNRHGYDVIVWASHGVAYTLVSEIGGRSCSVCHAPEEQLDVTLTPEIHGAR